MKKFAKLLAMVLAVSMVLTMFVGAYSDEAAIKEKEAVQAVYNYGIMSGDEKGNFNPERGLRRDEMAKIMFALKEYGLDASDKVIYSTFFSDASAIQDWAKGYIGYAYRNDIIVGKAGNTAAAQDTLSYAEAIIMLNRALELEDPITVEGVEYGEYTAAGAGDKWLENAIMDAFDIKLLDGLDIKDYRATITRQEVAVLIVNAIEYKQSAFKLAEPVTGTVASVEEDEDTGIVTVTLVTGPDAEKAFTCELDKDALKELLGFEITAIVEDGKLVVNGNQVCMAENAPVYSNTVLRSAIKEVDVKDEDGVVTHKNLEINGEVVVEKFDKANYELVTELDADVAAYDEVTLVINTKTLYVAAAPVQFFEFGEDVWAPQDTYDKDNKVWKGEYTVSFGGNGPYKISDAYVELEIEGWYSYQVVEGELVNLKALDDVANKDLTATFNKGEYAVSYKGNELVIYNECATPDGIWANSVKGEEYTAYLYNGYVLVDYVVVEEDTTDDDEPKVETYYGFIDNYDATVKVVEDDEKTEENEAGFCWTYTVDMITVDGKAKQFIYDDVQVELDYNPATWLSAKLVKITVTGEGEDAVIEGKALDDEIVYGYVSFIDLEKKLISARDIEDKDTTKFVRDTANNLLFVDCTESNLELKDIEVETKSNETTTEVAGKNVSALAVMVFKFDEQYVVVYDPALEFGLFGSLLPEDAE